MSEAKILETPSISHSGLAISNPEPILRESFHGQNENSIPSQRGDLATLPTAQVALEPAKTPKQKVKPTHYKVVCISLYTQDIENLEAKVAELKRRGHTKANKSQLIRQALRMLDIDKLPPPQQ